MQGSFEMKAFVLVAAAVTLSGCATYSLSNDVPDCARLIPSSLLKPVEGVDIPTPGNWPDGHEKAEPWQLGYLGQTGQLDKANENAPAVDHIYRTCLELHREALKRSQRGFFGRLFG
jgi:hypothetical protein